MSECEQCAALRADLAAAKAMTTLDESALTGWGLLLKAPITHGLGCDFVTLPDGKEWRAEDGNCTCGYEWRVRLATSMALHNAWRKRAEEAERDLAAAKAREKALQRFYDDFWFHAQPALGDWIVPANELEVADEEVKAAIAGSKT